jgi:hypothetical protein
MSDSDVFREVDEDYRHERMLAFWRRYGLIVLAALVLAVLAATGINYWRAQADAHKAAQTADLEALLSNVRPGSETASADALAAYATKASPPLATLALFSAASLRQRTGDLDGAAKMYHQIADGQTGDASPASASLRDLAVVRLGYIAVDQSKPEPLIPRLEALTATDNPWRYSAREAIALLTARAGQRESAATMFSDLARDPGAPSDLAGRARALADLYSGK